MIFFVFIGLVHSWRKYKISITFHTTETANMHPFVAKCCQEVAEHIIVCEKYILIVTG